MNYQETYEKLLFAVAMPSQGFSENAEKAREELIYLLHKELVRIEKECDENGLTCSPLYSKAAEKIIGTNNLDDIYINHAKR